MGLNEGASHQTPVKLSKLGTGDKTINKDVCCLATIENVYELELATVWFLCCVLFVASHPPYCYLFPNGQ